ncbi:MAG: carbon-nitrogen hydrolase family protein [Pseudomonadota bacterium]
MTVKIAIGQMNSADRHAPNVAAMEGFAAEAAAAGAKMLCLPEVAGLMNRNAAEAKTMVGPAANDPYIAAAQRAAQRHAIWLHAGSTPVSGPGEKFLNHSVLIAPDGRIAAEYDKIHLFDVALQGARPIGESKRFDAGNSAPVVATEFGPLGLTICYDLRFPGLYRALAQAGAEILFVPSAFTVPTGAAHWEVLLRARAIECGAFVIAAAQVGQHADGRHTWGHSLVIDPWGKVLLDLGGTAPGLGVVEIDSSAVVQARSQIPSLEHDRNYHIERIELLPDNDALSK